jgi:hypothetical protein
MYYGFKWWIGDNSLVKGSLLGNILNDCEIKLALRCVVVGLLDFVCLFLRSNSRHNGVTMLKQKIQDMGSNEAAATFKITLAMMFSSRTGNTNQ